MLLGQITSTINTVKCLVCVFSFKSRSLGHDNIVAYKGLNLFDECAAECVHLYPQEEECTSSS